MMTKVSVDFNDTGADGRVVASFRQAGDLKVGDRVMLSDPGESEEFAAVVASVNRELRIVTFDVDWEPVAFVVPRPFRFITMQSEAPFFKLSSFESTNPPTKIWSAAAAHVKRIDQHSVVFS